MVLSPPLASAAGPLVALLPHPLQTPCHPFIEAVDDEKHGR
jgi:hypothetical protein